MKYKRMIYGTNTAGKLSTAQTINNLVFTITSYFAAVRRRICFFPKKYLKINPKGTYIPPSPKRQNWAFPKREEMPFKNVTTQSFEYLH